MRCPHCGAENAADRRFCTECGTALVIVCQSCGSHNPLNAKFCGACGNSLAARMRTDDERPHTPPPELRQATMLFAHLCGFTQFSHELDPEVTHDLLDRFFEAVDGVVMRYGGSIEKHTGDGVMAVFGAPIAHDNDPERAVRAALGIHEATIALSKELGLSLQVHIGIASGSVLASGTGSRHHQEYSVTGDAANLASRLEDAAAPCETLVPDVVYRAVAHVVEADDAGQVKLEGFEQPIRVWKVRELRDESARMPQTPFVGRAERAMRFVGLRVLVVEDEPVISLSLENMLKELGCSPILHAGGVTEALAIICDHRPDVAVLDLYLAGEWAYPIAQRLDAENIPFVFMIGYGRHKIVGRWALRPAIKKPITMSALRRKLEAALDQRSS